MDKQTANAIFSNEYPQVIGKKNVSAEGLIKYRNFNLKKNQIYLLKI